MAELRLKPRALGKDTTTEVHPQPIAWLFMNQTSTIKMIVSMARFKKTQRTDHF
jgi:hypothetical protein